MITLQVKDHNFQIQFSMVLLKSGFVKQIVKMNLSVPLPQQDSILQMESRKTKMHHKSTQQICLDNLSRYLIEMLILINYQKISYQSLMDKLIILDSTMTLTLSQLVPIGKHLQQSMPSLPIQRRFLAADLVQLRSKLSKLILGKPNGKEEIL